jgi:hypothetical protein
MKTFKKSYLPDVIEYKGQILKLNAEATAAATLSSKNKVHAATLLKEIQDKTVCLVEVTNKNLKGKRDLYGNPYKPTVFIFSN